MGRDFRVLVAAQPTRGVDVGAIEFIHERLRSALEGAGFVIKSGQSPILPVMIGEAALAAKMADRLLEKGIYVIGFSYPVVPHGQARIRVQVTLFWYKPGTKTKVQGKAVGQDDNYSYQFENSAPGGTIPSCLTVEA